MIFGKNAEKCCALCEFGFEDEESGNIICEKKHKKQFEPDHKCLHFSYDPLKKKPHRAPKLHEHSAEEFRL